MDASHRRAGWRSIGRTMRTAVSACAVCVAIAAATLPWIERPVAADPPPSAATSAASPTPPPPPTPPLPTPPANILPPGTTLPTLPSSAPPPVPTRTFPAPKISFTVGRAQSDGALEGKLQKRGSLTLRDLPLADALFTIGEAWQVNIVVGKDVQGQVSGVFKDTPLVEVLDSILLSHGFAYRPVGQSLVVTKIDELGSMHPLMKADMIPLTRVKPAEILPALNALKSPQGKVEAIAAANSVLVIDLPDQLANMRRLAQGFDQAAAGATAEGTGEPAYVAEEYVTRFVKAKDLEESIKALLSDKGKSAIVDKENRIVVRDFPAHQSQIKKIIQQVDRPRQQVRITALIYDISIDDIENLGLNWSSSGKWRHDAAGVPQGSLALDTVLTQAPAAGATSGAVTFMNLSRHLDLTAVARALKEAKDARLLADPSVTVIDNEEAQIGIVQEIPYQQLTQTAGGGSIGTTAFKETGVKLVVTPRIGDDGTIQMRVQPSFSRLTGFTPVENQPIIDKRETQSSVRVYDRQTLVIGGLRQRSDVNERNGIPWLKDVKVIGPLFRSRSDTTREGELLVFLTPELVTPGEPHRPREAAAHDTGTFLLDNIPQAQKPIICDPQGQPLPHGTPMGPTTAPPVEQPGAVVHDVPTGDGAAQSVPQQPAREGGETSSGEAPLPPSSGKSSTGGMWRLPSVLEEAEPRDRRTLVTAFPHRSGPRPTVPTVAAPTTESQHAPRGVVRRLPSVGAAASRPATAADSASGTYRR